VPERWPMGALMVNLGLVGVYAFCDEGTERTCTHHRRECRWVGFRVLVGVAGGTGGSLIVHA
jgi:hypothetical protein